MEMTANSQERGARFWDRIAEKYARSPVSDQAAYERKLEITRRYLTLESEVLELGCGTGSTALLHAPFVEHIQATDISEKMIGIAREKAAGVENVTFERASVEDIDAPAAGYDAVLALNLLHLLHDRDAAIAKVHRLLKPGGVFISGTFCAAGVMWLLWPVLKIGGLFGRLPYVGFFPKSALLRSLERAGFEIVEDWHPGPRKAAFIVARKR